MTPRSLPRRTVPVPARRGLLLAGPALLLAGCGLLPSGEEDQVPRGGVEDAEGGGEAETSEEPAPDPATTATLDLTVGEVADEIVAGGLMSRLEGSETLIHPYAQATVVATTLLDSLTAEQYTALTGEEVPPAEGGRETGEERPATTLLPGEMKRFLLTAWESTDPGWTPAPDPTYTALDITYGGNQQIRLDSPSEGDSERSGTVLAIVDASPDPGTVALRAEMGGGVQELSLLDGSLLTTPAPRMYDGGLDVEVSEATILDTEVSDGFGQDVMTLHGTVEEAFLSPFVDTGLQYGGDLGWAEEDEIHLVVPLVWDRDYSANVDELTEVVLVLPDGTELRPAQDQARMFGSAHRRPVATFTVPASLDTATVKIMHRFGTVLDEDFEQVEDPVTATLTLA
ncbi:MAG: hypothetical protein L0J57_09770 [Brachybacterium sp.]|nr:hypothetical protein [Brachybacterium sp.]